MRMSPVSFAIAPRIVFDLRDWYQSTFTASQVPGRSPTEDPQRTIVRVLGKALFLADPTDPRDANWPFSETVELVTQDSGGGIRGFHGRVKTATGVLLRMPPSSFAKKTKCRLTVQVRGFQPSVTALFKIPGSDSTPIDNDSLVNEINLFPAADYPFPSGPRPTALLEGSVLRADGTGMAGATITPLDPRPAGSGIPLLPSTTTDNGRYVVVLDALIDADGTTSFSSIAIELSHPDWAAPIRHLVPFVANDAGRFIPSRRAVFPTTVLNGRVLRNGRPVPGATVRLSSVDEPLLQGTVQANTFGDWELYGDARLPLSGSDPSEAAKLTATANGQSADSHVVVHYGQRNNNLAISLPPT
ncbi:MAG: hypothetical protein WCJ09_27550 [Planctomycetota bacterium]